MVLILWPYQIQSDANNMSERECRSHAFQLNSSSTWVTFTRAELGVFKYMRWVSSATHIFISFKYLRDVNKRQPFLIDYLFRAPRAGVCVNERIFFISFISLRSLKSFAVFLCSQNEWNKNIFVCWFSSKSLSLSHSWVLLSKGEFCSWNTNNSYLSCVHISMAAPFLSWCLFNS